jgi:hypothetical protein
MSGWNQWYVLTVSIQNNETKQVDFGIKGKSALGCAGRIGRGKGCAMALAGKTVDEVAQQHLNTISAWRF